MKKVILLISVLSVFFASSLSAEKAAFTGGGYTGFFTIYGEYKDAKGKTVKGKGKINIYLPKNYNSTAKPFPLVIALPGWGRIPLAHEWETKAKASIQAENAGCVLVLVEVSKTAYETSFYPETNKWFKWGNIPGTLWVGEVVLPFVKAHFNVDKTGRKTGIFGLSTGGRGAVFIPQTYPKSFRAAVSMSGDFDRVMIYNWTKKTHKNIMAYDPPSVYMYGHPRNPEILKRWQTKDNPSSKKNILALKNNKISVLLIHGKADYVVLDNQSSTLYKKLIKAEVDVKFVNPDGLGHSFELWATYLPLAFDFFKEKFATD
jgi:S-formylglutathione hydrolase FrmB